MSWFENVLKFDLDETVNGVLEKLRNTIKHPNYDGDDILSYVDEGITIRMFSNFLDSLESGDTPDWKEFYDYHGQSIFLSMLSEIEFGNERYYASITRQRSMDWLVDFAETFGVKLINPTPSRVEFSHEGLRYVMRNSGLLRIYNQNPSQRVLVCIVDDNKLPIGDYYTQLMGLILTKPEELDVLDFAIKMIKLMDRHKDIAIIRDASIEIYTPFRDTNTENESFANLIEELKNRFIPSETTDFNDRIKSALNDIEAALIDVFGSTRGFF